MNQFIPCRKCGARNDAWNDFCIVCGICLHQPNTMPSAGTKRVVYSAVMDEDTCQACRSQESHKSEDVNRLMPVPNPRCTSLVGCRCFHIYETE
ncbi:MAG TPA: hypothetical protein VFC63_02320 [Blastocatellia bacterium]|nr:hypothetical protein [Blastocatellia bacterium]